MTAARTTAGTHDSGPHGMFVRAAVVCRACWVQLRTSYLTLPMSARILRPATMKARPAATATTACNV